MSHELLFISGFLIFIVLILALDLGLLSKREHTITLKQAAIMSFIMVVLALSFYLLLVLEGQYLHGIDSYARLEEVVAANKHPITLIPGHFEESLIIYKKNLGIEFLTGYVIEYALSVDNIFVIVLVFSAFAVPEKYYHRVLFWGILGAIVMRFIFIFAGAALIKEFSWILYVFGAFLLFTGVKMFFSKEEDDKIDPENHPVVKFAARFFKIHPRYEGKKFFHRVGGKKLITPLFLVLLIVEFTDLIFAVDSIPAIFAVTKDAYIVFFSNIFAIMGLRSMFFLLVNIIHKFHYLKTGLAILLTFIGVKMLAHDYLKGWGFTTEHSLIVIVSILTASIVASLAFPKKRIKPGL
ncbi:TerC/Alx family metal homeostasis membrane protein [Pedobacter insulae]|uniref:Tellurite resistance protein TerC n=1 Tax=Pedobacter insulae TaxID=414048 RepID=A0A1I2ZUF6_9SPHI|nr:TerC/Alx family metal homeostasis membrane protein [Pedobacter insulae]SFH41320.1 tellurite resistance protein TerC [Pedobacter insulae]